MDDSILYRLFLQDGWWQTSRAVAELYNDFETAGVFAELVSVRHLSEKRGTLIDDWFTATYAEMAKNTFISENKIGQCIRTFVSDNVLETKRVGIPSKCFYRLNMQNLMRALESSTKLSSTDSSYTRPTETCHVKDKEVKSKEIDDEGKDSSSSKEPVDTVPPISKGLTIARRKPKVSIFPNDAVERLFNHWNNLGDHIASHKADPSTKTFQLSVASIDKALRKYSPDQIANAITNYSKLLSDDETTLYWPTQSKRPGLIVGLIEFFKFGDFTEERMIKAKEVDLPESWFTLCLGDYETISLQYGKYDKDDNPSITESIQKAYIAEIGLAKITVSDKNIFIKASKYVLQYHKENKHKINWNGCLIEKNNVGIFARRLVHAIKSDCPDTTMITPSWLVSDRTKTSRFPKFLRKQGLLTSDEIATKPQTRGLNLAPKKKGYDPGYKDGEIE